MSEDRTLICEVDIPIIVPKRMMVLAGHPDDELVSCGGTILKYQQLGSHITIVVATQGLGGYAKEENKHRVVERREAEIQHVTEELNWELIELGYSDIEINRKKISKFTNLIREIKPQVILLPHYTDFHRGVVFKLKVLPELDNPICVARPVIYKSKLPVFFTLKQWVEDLIDLNPIDHKRLIWDYAYIKSDKWAYEKEWRVWDLKPEGTSDLYSDYKLYPEELEAIYFGCMMGDETKPKIIDAAKAFNPRVSFYQAEKSKTEFGLIFNKI